mgnify:CR=1 FL=1
MKMIYLASPMLLFLLVACIGSKDGDKKSISPVPVLEPKPAQGSQETAPPRPEQSSKDKVEIVDHRSNYEVASTRFLECELLHSRWQRKQSFGNPPPVHSIDYTKPGSWARLVIDEDSRKVYIYGKKGAGGYFGDAGIYWFNGNETPENLGQSICVDQLVNTRFSLKIADDTIESESSFTAPGVSMEGKLRYSVPARGGEYACVEETAAYSDTPAFDIRSDYKLKNCRVHVFEKRPFRSYVLTAKMITEFVKKKIESGIHVDGISMAPRSGISKLACQSSGIFAARLNDHYKGQCQVTAVFEATQSPAPAQRGKERTLELEVEVSFDGRVKVISVDEKK